MSSHPVIIVGAGLAGLTFGRCLRHHGIPTIILEKSKSLPQSNYVITLHPWAYRPLLQVLDVDEVAFRKDISVYASSRAIGTPLPNTVMPSTGAGTSSFRCHRGRLEQFLREGQNIRWDHRLENIDLSAQGITVKIADKEIVKADVLVATDGVHSKVRQLLAPNLALKVLPYVVFNGKRVIGVEDYQKYIESEMQGNTIIQYRHDDVNLEISIIEYEQENVHLSYTYSRPTRPNDVLHRPNRSKEEASQIPEAFYSELDQLADLRGAFTRIFQSSNVRKDRVLHWLMRSSLGTPSDIENLARRGVLLIGDAVHAMAILGGDGGNMAIKDAIDLAEYLTRHGTKHLEEFTKLKYDTWRTTVENCEIMLANMHSSTRALL